MSKPKTTPGKEPLSPMKLDEDTLVAAVRDKHMAERRVEAMNRKLNDRDRKACRDGMVDIIQAQLVDTGRATAAEARFAIGLWDEYGGVAGCSFDIWLQLAKARPDSNNHESLLCALLAAQKEMRAVAKEGLNKHHGYKFARGDDVILAARECLHKHGLMVTRGKWRLKRSVVQKADDDGPYTGTDYLLVAQMKLTHVSTNEVAVESIVFPVVPERGRPLDKAMAGALTTSMAYWLRDKLLIPREDAQEEARQASAPRDVAGRDDSTYTPPKTNRQWANAVARIKKRANEIANDKGLQREQVVAQLDALQEDAVAKGFDKKSKLWEKMVIHFNELRAVDDVGPEVDPNTGEEVPEPTPETNDDDSKEDEGKVQGEVAEAQSAADARTPAKR